MIVSEFLLSVTLIDVVYKITRNYQETYCSVSVFILHNENHPPPAILLDDAVEHTGKVDLRWQQLEVVGKPNTITQLIR